MYHLPDRGSRRDIEADVITRRAGGEEASKRRREVDFHLHGSQRKPPCSVSRVRLTRAFVEDGLWGATA